MDLNILHVDQKIWILLQNVTLLDSDFLKETDEYDTFKTASEQDTTYIISQKDILDDDKSELKYHFKSFTEMIISIKQILEIFEKTSSKKYKILVKSMPIMERISMENALENMRI